MTQRPEFERIARFSARLRGKRDPSITLGIGDDAAVIDPALLLPGERLVWTVDAAIEGVHFRREWASFNDVGYRSVLAAASDLLAMGARPLAALCAWTIPPDVHDEQLDEICEGQRQAAVRLGFSIVGGNLASGPVLSLTTTALGATRSPVTRAGARVGDLLVVSGALGHAALGLRILATSDEHHIGKTAGHAEESGFVAAWRRPHVALEVTPSLAAIAHAMIDVSDGLAQDVGHLATASGVRAVLEAPRIIARRTAEAVRVASRMAIDLDALELAGGEDYALVAAVDAHAVLPPLVDVIGRIEAGRIAAGEVLIEDAPGVVRSAPEGYRHR